MGSTATLRDANKVVGDLTEILKAFSDPYMFAILHLLHRRGPRTVEEIEQELGLPVADVKSLLAILDENGLVVQSGVSVGLSSFAERRLTHGSLTLDFLVGTTLRPDPAQAHALRNSYVVKERIGKGATSVTFRAEQSGVYRERTLKIFLPGTVTYEQLDAALRKLAKVHENIALPEIVDAGQVPLRFPDGTSLVAACVVLRYINEGARTFAEFLRTHANLTSKIFELFVERVGGALAAIEAAGLNHGDLHEGNILVVPGEVPGLARDFWVIDYIGLPSIKSSELDVPPDIENTFAIISCEPL